MIPGGVVLGFASLLRSGGTRAGPDHIFTFIFRVLSANSLDWFVISLFHAVILVILFHN
jgi:hypothetical protein